MRKIALALLIAGWGCSSGWCEEFIQIPAAIQISSQISDGKYSIPEIVSAARRNNFKAVIITDRDAMRWEYGLFPFANIIKKTVADRSVLQSGIRGYLSEIENAQLANSDLVVIGGLESAPFYYWTGSILGNSLKIMNWHKHLLIVGLEEYRDIAHLPVIGNRKGLVGRLSWQSIWLLGFPLVAIFAAMRLLLKRQFKYKDDFGHPLGPFSRLHQGAGVVLLVLGVLFLCNNYPYRGQIFDQYHGDAGIFPYQNLINYVTQKGGLVFWAHPEAKYILKQDNVAIETQEHTQDLLRSTDYTGYAVFYEGYEKVGRPGGIWDDLLLQYCAAIRSKPIWAIAGLSFDATGDLDAAMKDLKVVLLARGLSKSEIIGSLREGRLYAAKGSNSHAFVLDVFSATERGKNITKTMGEQIDINASAKLRITAAGRFLHGQNNPVKVKLIRDGVIIKIFASASPFQIEYDDQPATGANMHYYRLEIESNGLLCVTNPIFARKIQ